MNTPGFNLTTEQATTLLAACLKPEEIGGDAVTQHNRLDELVHWFARLAKGNANPKWATAHAMELAYYIATEMPGRQLDLRALRTAGWKEGINATPQERTSMVRIGVATDYPEYRSAA